ncbi:hypothetical protein JCM14076_25370 [Methylosoma difficile]
MGYSLSWLSCRGLSEDTLLTRLSLKNTHQSVEYAHTATAMQPLPDHWLLVVGKGCDHRIIQARLLATLSLDCEVVACSIEEHVMYASSEHWCNGKRVWRIEHAGETSLRHLVVEGDTPAFYPSIVAACEKNQAASEDVDGYFEIPLECAKQLVGFKHDEEHPSLDYSAFQNLSKQSAIWQWW